MMIHSILDHGAVGAATALDTVAIQAAIDACAAGGGGTVCLPAGRTYRAGSFELKSNIEFRVERGAVSDRVVQSHVLYGVSAAEDHLMEPRSLA